MCFHLIVRTTHKTISRTEAIQVQCVLTLVYLNVCEYLFVLSIVVSTTYCVVFVLSIVVSTTYCVVFALSIVVSNTYCVVFVLSIVVSKDRGNTSTMCFNIGVP
jgi:hypothetical protein